MMNKRVWILLPLLLLVSEIGCAAEQLAAASLPSLQLKTRVQQPYVVRKHDTLWDIANHFFKNPHQWLKIWERNLTITNPDLIYPGNKIWFDNSNRAKSGGLSTIRPQPEVVMRPVERVSSSLDQSMVLGVLARQDLISPDAVHGVGYVLDGRDGRLHFATNDEIYIHLDHTAVAGDVFDVFRLGEAITEPGSKQSLGILTLHLGQLQVLSKSGAIYRAKVVRAFEEISRGNFLRPARSITASITPSSPTHKVQGRIIHIRNNAAEAGQNQVVAVDIGTSDGMKQGTELHVFHKGREVKDPMGDTMVRLPSERIATLIVISPQQAGSLALVIQSSTSINLGDEVRGEPSE